MRMRYPLIAVLLLAGCSSPTAPTPPRAVVVTPPVVVAPPPVAAPNPLLSDPRFDAAFYRQFTSSPLYRWNQAPRVYLRTIDDGGQPVPAGLLDQTAAALINTASQWTGGAFGLAGLERGTGTRTEEVGWITVGWSTSGVCGIAPLTRVGPSHPQEIASVTIVMNHARPECTCGPLVTKHELGHAFGFQHTDSPNDLMAATFQGVCDRPLSAREAFHAQVAYSMAVGSAAP